MIAADNNPAWRHPGRREQRLNFPERIRGGPRVRCVDRHIGIDGAGSFPQPDLRQPDHVGALRSGKATTRVADEDDNRPVGFLNGDRMTLTIIVRVTRDRHGFLGMRAGSQRDCKTNKRSRRAAGANAVDGYFHCHRFRPRPVSVGDKAIGAAIIPGGLYPARNAIDTIDVADQIGLRI